MSASRRSFPVQPTASKSWPTSSVTPDQPTVVLAHGGGQTRHSWSGAMRALGAEGYRVINYRRARSWRQRLVAATIRYDLDLRAHDLRAVLKGTTGPVALVGASMGGATAMNLVSDGYRPPRLTPGRHRTTARNQPEWIASSPLCAVRSRRLRHIGGRRMPSPPIIPDRPGPIALPGLAATCAWVPTTVFTGTGTRCSCSAPKQSEQIRSRGTRSGDLAQAPARADSGGARPAQRCGQRSQHRSFPHDFA